MVECCHEVKEGELQIREMKIVDRMAGQGLELTDKIIAQVAHGSSEKRRDLVGAYDRRLLHHLRKLVEWLLSGLGFPIRGPEGPVAILPYEGLVGGAGKK